MNKCIIILLLCYLTTANLLFAQIAADFKADTTVICEGYWLHFTDQSISDTITNWLWNFGDTASHESDTSILQNPVHAYNTEGVYTVSLTASNFNYSNKKEKLNYILVRKLPDAIFTFTDTMFLPSYIFCFHGTVLNRDDSSYKYYWSFNQTSYQQGDTIAINTFPAAGNYVVSFMADAGAGCKDTVYNTVQVNDVLEAPNIFSPNNDGINDVFIVKSNGANEFELYVFNRWGATVYLETARRLQWDGRTSAGIKLPCGTYFYYITSPDIKEYKKAGVILLVK